MKFFTPIFNLLISTWNVLIVLKKKSIIPILLHFSILSSASRQHTYTDLVLLLNRINVERLFFMSESLTICKIDTKTCRQLIIYVMRKRNKMHLTALYNNIQKSSIELYIYLLVNKMLQLTSVTLINLFTVASNVFSVYTRMFSIKVIKSASICGTLSETFGNLTWNWLNPFFSKGQFSSNALLYCSPYCRVKSSKICRI